METEIIYRVGNWTTGLTNSSEFGKLMELGTQIKLWFRGD